MKARFFPVFSCFSGNLAETDSQQTVPTAIHRKWGLVSLFLWITKGGFEPSIINWLVRQAEKPRRTRALPAARRARAQARVIPPSPPTTEKRDITICGSTRSRQRFLTGRSTSSRAGVSGRITWAVSLPGDATPARPSPATQTRHCMPSSNRS